MTNSIEEILGAELMFIIGSNATEAHPIIGNKMKRAANRGTKMIVVDPRETELAYKADLWLQLKPGTDVALINGMMNVILKNGWQDQMYIDQRCEDFEDLKAIVEKYPVELASKISGVPVEKIELAAKMYAQTNKAGIFYTLGITEHTTGTENVMSLSNLALITGHIGMESAGVNPMRGQNNVQGACDMGALPNVYPAYQQVNNPKIQEFFEELWGYKLSSRVGYQIPYMFKAAIAGELKAMVIMGEDPVLTDPDANHVKKALENLDLLVAQDIFLSETAKMADVVFPASCYAEKDGTFTNTERRVQRVRKAVEMPGEARNDWSIIAELAKRMGAHGFKWRSSNEIFEEMRKAMPSYRGMSYARIDKVGLQWPCPTESHPGTKFLHKGVFTRGKGKLMGIDYKPPAELPDSEYDMMLTTGRHLHHYNITTRFSPSLEAISPHELAEIHPDDAARLDLEELDWIKVTSRRGEVVTRVTVTDKVQPGLIFMTLHFKESPVNEVTSDAVDPITGTGEYKVAAIKVEKVAPKEEHKDTVLRFVNMMDLIH